MFAFLLLAHFLSQHKKWVKLASPHSSFSADFYANLDWQAETEMFEAPMIDYTLDEYRNLFRLRRKTKPGVSCRMVVRFCVKYASKKTGRPRSVWRVENKSIFDAILAVWKLVGDLLVKSLPPPPLYQENNLR